MKLLIIENSYADLLKSRIPLGSYLKKKGFNVFYACPEPSDNQFFDIEMDRDKVSLNKLVKSTNRLSGFERENSIDTVLSFRFIPNVINYLSSFSNSNVKRIAVVTGLGIAFSEKSLKFFIIKKMIKAFYNLAKFRLKIVTQNKDDLKILGLYTKGTVIFGSGFSNENKLNKTKLTNKNNINLLYVGRLLKSKGIDDVLKIFKELNKISDKFSLTIAGGIDEDNPNSISSQEIQYLKKHTKINYLGFVSDLSKVYEKNDILVFPTKYREGIPRVIIESLSYGLTIITTNTPGCKETVLNNGFLIREGSLDGVINYIKTITKEVLIKNSIKSKELFKDKFSSEVIYPQYEKVIS